MEQFRDLFGEVFDIKRSRATERLRILRLLGEFGKCWPATDRFKWIYEDQMRLGGGEGLYTQMRQSAVFADDPLEKKVRIFVHQLLRYGLIRVADPENIAPAVDYHLIRLYLRTGRVLALDDVLLERLSEERTARVEFHTNLRKAVEEAMYYSAMGAGLRVDQLNDVEWQIARSFCTRRIALCWSSPIAEKPIDARVADLFRRVGGCPLLKDCRGARDEVLRGLVDPRSVRPYY